MPTTHTGPPLVASELLSPENYARDCHGQLAEVMAHREARTVRVGPHVILMFEDERTVRHQLREMLRIERISEPASVKAEIDYSYAGLIPNGRNLKATFMLEFADAEQRRAIGPGLAGIEQAVWIRVEGWGRIAGEVDKGVSNEATVGPPLTYRLTFALGKAEVRDLVAGSRLSVGADRGEYRARVMLPDVQRALLLKDLL